jgi:hypothetical protein
VSKSELRHFCRHCRGKLPAPAANPREAFDSKGCHRSFYRHRCIVCERDMPRLGESQRTCYRADCKEKWRQKTVQSHFIGTDSTSVKDPLKTSIKQGVKEADKYDRRWFIVAGKISPNALHCATVPDGPGGSWGSGSVERIEAQNRRALKAHFAELSEKVAVQRQHMPLNIQGHQPTYRVLKLGPEKTLDEIRDRVASGVPFDDPDAEQWKIPDPVISGMGYDRLPVPKQEPHAGTIPADLSIPAFLDRRSVGGA